MAKDGTRETLTKGDKGEAVEELQARLVELGANIEIDGWYGKATAQAVTDFQKRNGLTVDGIAGPETCTALEPKAKKVPPKVAAVGAGVTLAGVVGSYFHEAIMGVIHAIL